MLVKQKRRKLVSRQFSLPESVSNSIPLLEAVCHLRFNLSRLELNQVCGQENSRNGAFWYSKTIYLALKLLQSSAIGRNITFHVTETNLILS